MNRRAAAALARDDGAATKPRARRERPRRVRDLAGRIEAFARHLERFPYLGLAHPVGERIAAAVGRAPKATLQDATWYRARLPKGPERYGSAALGPPEATHAEGRFNHYGQTVFYRAEQAAVRFHSVRPGRPRPRPRRGSSRRPCGAPR